MAAVTLPGSSVKSGNGDNLTAISKNMLPEIFCCGLKKMTLFCCQPVSGLRITARSKVLIRFRYFYKSPLKAWWVTTPGQSFENYGGLRPICGIFSSTIITTLACPRLLENISNRWPLSMARL